MRKKALGLVLSLALLASILSGTAAADVSLSPSAVTAELNLGESMDVDKMAHIDAFPPVPVDVYFLVDTTGSFFDDLVNYKAQAAGIVNTLIGSGLDVHFGLGNYRDYPISPFGGGGDYAYVRNMDISAPADSDLNGILDIVDAINALSAGGGADFEESQLPAMFQAATGAGQDLSGAGFPGASIPAGQQASYRSDSLRILINWTDAEFHEPGDPGTIPYPGPSFADTIAALNASDIKVIGIGAPTTPTVLTHLQTVSAGTGTLAPPGGVDCNADGVVDVPEGAPLVCVISSTGSGIGDAIVAAVNALALTADVALVPLDNPATAGVDESTLATTSPVYTDLDLKVAHDLAFTETIACPDEAWASGMTFEFDVALMAGSGTLATQHVTLTCVMEVEIDIKPNSYPSSWNCNSRGDIPVAVLGSDSFDATAIDPNTVTFGKTGTETGEVHRDGDGNARMHLEDYNGDGWMDMVFHFDWSQTGFSCADIPAGEKSWDVPGYLNGETTGGTPFTGTDMIRLVGKE